MYEEIGDYIIREWQMEDAPALAECANNRKIWMNLRDAFPHPYGIKDAETFISRVIEADPKTIFAIATRSKPVGSIGLMPGKDVHRHTAELGYWLAEPYWGKGIMTQAVIRMTEYAIDELSMHRVFAEPYATNRASARVLEKSGYTCEAMLRSSVYKDGKILDQYLYSYIAKRAHHLDAKGHAGLGGR